MTNRYTSRRSCLSSERGLDLGYAYDINKGGNCHSRYGRSYLEDEGERVLSNIHGVDDGEHSGVSSVSSGSGNGYKVGDELGLGCSHNAKSEVGGGVSEGTKKLRNLGKLALGRVLGGSGNDSSDVYYIGLLDTLGML